ncbi:MAG: riboflavin synthase, partial [Hyphomicrobiales bacterium]
MFTGITTDVGEVISVEPKAEGLRRLKVACAYPRAGIAIGASIAHSGVCLTVVETGEQGGRTWFAVDAAAETLRLTTAGAWKSGTKLNLERALKVGDELGGHIVAGHVDGVATLTARENLPDMARLTLQAPRELMRFVATKGSVAL